LKVTVAALVYKALNTAEGIRPVDHATLSIRKNWHLLLPQTAVARSVYFVLGLRTQYFLCMGLRFTMLLKTFVRLEEKKTPWTESASELYRPSYRRLSAKSLPTFAHRGCHVVSVMDPYCRILRFLDRQMEERREEK
jgi:hypothetical protein